jgi:Ca2+-binding RTX toxin-like protein
MFYYFRQDDDTETANITWRTFAVNDRISVAAGVHLYASGAGARVFAAAAGNTFLIAGEVVSDATVIRSIDANAYGISVTVAASGVVYSSTLAIRLETGNVTNDGLISGITEVTIRGDGVVLAQIENLSGSAFSDTLTGNEAANVLSGGGGNDILNGAGGNDRFFDVQGSNTITGGLGNDTADYSRATGPIVVNLFGATDYVTRAGEMDTVDVENFVGSGFDDEFISGFTVNGFTGGAGADRFVFAPGTASSNIIRDFSGIGGDGDQLIFDGWDGDVTFTQVDATHWRIQDAGNNEIITFANGALIVPADVIFT